MARIIDKLPIELDLLICEFTHEEYTNDKGRKAWYEGSGVVGGSRAVNLRAPESMHEIKNFAGQKVKAKCTLSVNEYQGQVKWAIEIEEIITPKTKA